MSEKNTGSNTGQSFKFKIQGQVVKISRMAPLKIQTAVQSIATAVLRGLLFLTLLPGFSEEGPAGARRFPTCTYPYTGETSPYHA